MNKCNLVYTDSLLTTIIDMPPRPPISPEKRKERYLEAVRDKMAKLYAYGEANPPAREQLWHEITGFLEAGAMMKAIKTEAVQAALDVPYLNAFGMTREEIQVGRSSRQQLMSKARISTMRGLGRG